MHTTVPWIAGQTVAKGIHDYFVAAVHMHPFFRKQQAVQRGIKEHAMAIQQRHNMWLCACAQHGDRAEDVGVMRTSNEVGTPF